MIRIAVLVWILPDLCSFGFRFDQISAILNYTKGTNSLCCGLNERGHAGNPVVMLQAIFQRGLIALLTLALVGGTIIQSTFPALAAPMSHASMGDSPVPCDHMQMAKHNAASNRTMPCNSMPCKGSLGDCLQMCLGICAPPTIGNLPGAPATPNLRHAIVWWPRAVAPTGLSVQPDPFPPKRLISA